MDGQSSRTLAHQSVSLAEFPSWQRLSPICPPRRARHVPSRWILAASTQPRAPGETRADLGWRPAVVPQFLMTGGTRSGKCGTPPVSWSATAAAW